MKAANELHAQLDAVYAHADQVGLNDVLRSELNINDWSAALGDWELPVPTTGNIGDWLQKIDEWVAHTAGHLGTLCAEALEQLLACEATVRHLTTQALSPARTRETTQEPGSSPSSPPSPPAVPTDYATLLPSTERDLQKKLGLWDRFQTADGVVAGTLRLLVSIGIIGGALYLTLIVQTTLV